MTDHHVPDRDRDDPPLEWYVCPACDGSGIIARRITVYEHGCGFPHDDTAEDPCGNCGGEGGKWSDLGDDPYRMN